MSFSAPILYCPWRTRIRVRFAFGFLFSTSSFLSRISSSEAFSLSGLTMDSGSLLKNQGWNCMNFLEKCLKRNLLVPVFVPRNGSPVWKQRRQGGQVNRRILVFDRLSWRNDGFRFERLCRRHLGQNCCATCFIIFQCRNKFEIAIERLTVNLPATTADRAKLLPRFKVLKKLILFNSTKENNFVESLKLVWRFHRLFLKLTVFRWKMFVYIISWPKALHDKSLGAKEII